MLVAPDYYFVQPQFGYSELEWSKIKMATPWLRSIVKNNLKTVDCCSTSNNDFEIFSFGRETHVRFSQSTFMLKTFEIQERKWKKKNKTFKRFWNVFIQINLISLMFRCSGYSCMSIYWVIWNSTCQNPQSQILTECLRNMPSHCHKGTHKDLFTQTKWQDKVLFF